MVKIGGLASPNRLEELTINVSVLLTHSVTQVRSRLSQFRRRELHWLHLDDRVRFRVCAQVYKCLHNMAPGYLSTLCQPVSSVPGRCHLRSARLGELDFPRVNLTIRTGDGRLPTPVPHLGTLYLTVSRTLILLCKLSNAI